MDKYDVWEFDGRQYVGTLKSCLRMVAKYTEPADEWAITNESGQVIIQKFKENEKHV